MTTQEATDVKTIKQVTTDQIETAFASALTELLGAEHKVSISKIDFSANDRLGGIGLIPMELSVSKVWEPGPFPGSI